MAAHLQEAPVIGPLPADEDRIHDGLLPANARIRPELS